MATPNTNRAVDDYRKLLKTMKQAEELEDSLHKQVRSLSPEEFSDYMRMTTEIDDALNALPDDVAKSVWKSVVNKAGLDTSKV